MTICVIDRPSRDILLCIGTQPLVGGAVRWNKRWLELSGGLLTCLMPASSNMFDSGILTCLACLVYEKASSGALQCVCDV